MARNVRLDPITGLPTTRIVSSTPPPPRSIGGYPAGLTPLGLRTGNLGTQTSALGPRSAPQLPPEDFPEYTGSAPIFPGHVPIPSAPTAPPTSSSSSTPSGSQTKPGTSPPDYATIIANDPGLVALRAALAAGNITADEFRRQAIRRALQAYGAVPEGLSDPFGDVDPLTRNLAEKNTAEGLSTVAQEDRAHQLAVQQLQNVLAARGMLQSGGLGVGLGLEAQSDKQTRSKDVAQLLDYLNGQAAAYAEHINQSKLQEAGGISDATTRAYTNNPDTSGGVTKPGTYTVTSNGQKFDFGANGKPRWGLVRNATSLPGNTAPQGVGSAMYNADDPTLDANLTAAKQAGNEVGVWIVPRAGETAQQLGQRAADISKKYGVEVMFDSELSSKGYAGSPEYNYTADFVKAYHDQGGQAFSVTVQGGGEDDYNYKAVTDNGGTVWIQTYGADVVKDQMDPQAAVDKMIARGVPVSQIGVMLAPGQNVPHGPNGEPIQWSLYTVDDLGSTQWGHAGTNNSGPNASAPPAGSGADNAIQNALGSGDYSEQTRALIAKLAQQAYTTPVPNLDLRTPRSAPGMG